MTQAVQAVQNFSELQSLTRKGLIELVKQFKAEDTDCLQDVNGKSKTEDLAYALAVHMGFIVEAEIKSEVNKDIAETVQDEEPPVDPTAGLYTFGDDAHLNPALTESDVMDFGDDVPTLKATSNPFGEEVGPIQTARSMFSEDYIEDTPQADEQQAKPSNDAAQIADIKAQVETTGDAEVDSVLAELGLDGIDTIVPENPNPIGQTQQAAEAEAQPEAEDKPKRGGRKATIPMDAPIPVRQYDKLLLGVYGNILTERDEPFPEGHKFEGMTHEEIKLERFNPKAHELFRKTKGHMHLLYTNVGATYLIVYKKADGTLDPVLEVSNKGRGHLRCKQIANMLQVAYNEKNDQEIISAEDYQKLVEQIELLPINAESVGV